MFILEPIILLLFMPTVWKVCSSWKQIIYRLNWLFHKQWLYNAPILKWTMPWRGGNCCRQNTEQLDMDMWIQQPAALPFMKSWHISRLTIKQCRLQGLFLSPLCFLTFILLKYRLYMDRFCIKTHYVLREMFAPGRVPLTDVCTFNNGALMLKPTCFPYM